MTERWVKGQLEGTCVGTATRGRGGTGLARWYRLELTDAVVSQWAPVAGPPPPPTSGRRPFSQPRVEEAVLRARGTGLPDEAVALADASVWSWSTRDQVEEDGQSRCTLEGTVYARVVDRGKVRRPARTGPDSPPARLDRLGCLGLAVGLLVATWLWWSCGAVTSLLWAVGVLASWWTLAARHRRQPPLTTAVKVGHGVLGALLIAAAAGAALDLVDPARLSTCGTEDGTRVLLAMGALLGASLLAVAWPLPWLWGLWTVVMLLWCGRSGSDCAGHWLQRGYQGVRSVAPREVDSLEERLRELKERVLPGSGPAPSSKAPGPAGTAPGSGSGRRGGTGSGAEEAAAGDGDSAVGQGERGGLGRGRATSSAPGGEPGAPGSTGQPGAGTAPGSGGEEAGAPAGGPQRKAPAAPGKRRPAGATPGPGEASEGGAEPGSTASPAPAQRPGPAGTPGDERSSWANELRVTIEAALLDPAAFFGGGQRVTLGGDLLFAFDEDVLRPEAVPKLKQVARLLRLDPRKRVLLEGHADTVGGDAYNQDLSERRAAAVRTWLVEVAHINPSQIDTVGFGSSRPIAPEGQGPAAQQLNRRVEVRVLNP